MVGLERALRRRPPRRLRDDVGSGRLTQKERLRPREAPRPRTRAAHGEASRHLDDLIDQGIRHNADLRAAEAAVRLAQVNALAQRGVLFPQIAANWNSTRQKVPTATLDTSAASGASIYTVHTAQVTVAYVADVFGGNRRQIETAEALAEAQAFQRESIYLTLTANIALAAIQEAALRGQIDVTRRAIEVQTRLLAILRRQQDSGQIALPDVVAQETAVAQARLLLPALQRQLEQQRHLLAVLTGRFPSEDATATFRVESFKLPRAVPLSVPADLVRQRPDIRAAEAGVRSDDPAVRGAKMSVYRVFVSLN